jgi:hypothetical protein
MAEHRTHNQVRIEIGRERTARHQPAIDHRRDRGADPAGDADLLVALQQRIVERAVGVDVAVQDIILDEASALFQHRAAEPRDLRAQPVFLRPCRLEILAKRARPIGIGGARLGDDRRSERVDPRLECDHLGIIGPEGRELLLIFGIEPGDLRAQWCRVDAALGGRAAQCGFAVSLLGRDPTRLARGECRIERDQRASGQRVGVAAFLAAAGADQPLRLRVGGQLALRPFQIAPRGGDLALQERARVR